jgi:hypothetical protein
VRDAPLVAVDDDLTVEPVDRNVPHVGTLRRDRLASGPIRSRATIARCTRT